MGNGKSLREESWHICGGMFPMNLLDFKWKKALSTIPDLEMSRMERDSIQYKMTTVPKRDNIYRNYNTNITSNI